MSVRELYSLRREYKMQLEEQLHPITTPEKLPQADSSESRASAVVTPWRRQKAQSGEALTLWREAHDRRGGTRRRYNETRIRGPHYKIIRIPNRRGKYARCLKPHLAPKSRCGEGRVLASHPTARVPLRITMENNSERRKELWLITALVALVVLIVLRFFHHRSCWPPISRAEWHPLR